MTPKLRSLITCLILGALPTQALAGGGSGDVKIVEVYLRADGSIMKLQVQSGTYINNDGCEDGGMYVLERDRVGAPAFDLVTRQATAAMVADLPVSIWLEGCTRVRHWGKTRPAIFDVRVKPR